MRAGFESSTHLLEKVRQRPYSVLLLRNADHAHEEISRLILSIITDGALSDSMGWAITFRYTIVFVSGRAADQWGCDFEIEMSSPAADDRRGAVQFWLRELQSRLEPRVKIEMQDSALHAFVTSADDFNLLRQRFRERVETPIAHALLDGTAAHFQIQKGDSTEPIKLVATTLYVVECRSQDDASERPE